MAYRRKQLDDHAPELPASSMPAMNMLEPDGPHQAMRSLSTLPSSCRVLMEAGLRGSPTFTTLDGDNPTYTAAARKYADETTERVFARIHDVPLTPGHVLALEVLALPSGPLQLTPSTNKWEEAGRGGQVLMSVTYTNDDADTVTVETAVTPSVSQQIYGAIPASGHASMTAHVAVAYPWAALPSAVDLEKWTRGADVKASAVLSYVGSPRPVDVAVVERPSQIVVDTASSTWPTAMYVSAGEPYAELPSDYPITRITTADPGGGLDACRRALVQHGAQLGPCLAWISSAKEKGSTLTTWISYNGTGDDEAPAFSASATSYRNIPYTTSGHLSGLPGFSLGGYARQSRDSNEWFDERTGVLPVWLVVYGKGTTGDTTCQFRAGNDEWAAVNVGLTGTYGWRVAPGWIEVGVTPEDAPIGRFYCKDAGGAAWYVRDAAAFMRVT